MVPSIADKLAALNPTCAPKPKTPETRSNHLLSKTNTHTDIKLTGAITSPKARDRKPKKFIIQRLIPSLSRSGFTFLQKGYIQALVDWVHDIPARATSAEVKDAHKPVSWRYGSMLLLVHSTHIKAPKRKMKNMHASVRNISGKLLQTVDSPWGLPGSLPFATEKEGGVPFKIAYPKVNIGLRDGGGRTFLAGEPLWVLTKPGEDPDCLIPVIDFEGGRGEVYAGKLIWGVESVPWGVRVDPVWMEETIQKFDDELCEWYAAGLIPRITQMKESRLKEGLQETDEESMDTATDLSDEEKPSSKKRLTKALKKRDAEGNVKEGETIAGTDSTKNDDGKANLPTQRTTDALKKNLENGSTKICENPAKRVKKVVKEPSTQALGCAISDL